LIIVRINAKTAVSGVGASEPNKGLQLKSTKIEQLGDNLKLNGILHMY